MVFSLFSICFAVGAVSTGENDANLLFRTGFPSRPQPLGLLTTLGVWAGLGCTLADCLLPALPLAISDMSSLSSALGHAILSAFPAICWAGGIRVHNR